MGDRPCASFVEAETYRAYCGRCHFSKFAHEHWDEWSEDDDTEPALVEIEERVAVIERRSKDALIDG